MNEQSQSPETAAESDFGQALSYLEGIFGVQCPRWMDRMVVRRLFTIAARASYEKVKDNPSVIEKLKIIGAKIPEQRGLTLTCFGVLYEKGHRHCELCDIKETCAVEAANFGLGAITIHPSLLGSKTRVVVLMGPKSSTTPISDTIMDAVSETNTSGRDFEIRAHLEENFLSLKVTRPNRLTEICYRHKDQPPSQDSLKWIFVIVEKNDGRLWLRFSNASVDLQGKLEKHHSFYLPQSIAASEAITLIDQHAKETFT